jgi:uncharacterized damage-inducible protein DinB
MKKMIPATLLVFFFSIVLAFTGKAQLSMTDIKEQMIKDWQRAKAYTVEYLNTMPADKYSFRPVDSIRSFAEQMLHLSAANILLMMNAADTKPTSWFASDIEHSKTAQNKDSVMYYVTNSYDYCIDAVKNFDVNRWTESTKMFNMFTQSRYALMNKAFEHQGHHRGQTTIYIRLQGIKPPQEKLF